MILNIKAIASIIAVLAVFGAGWGIRGMRCDNARLLAENTAYQDALAATKHYNEIAADYERVKSEKQQTKIIYRERIRNAKDSSFGCHVNPDGVQLINDARSSGNSSQPDK